MTVVWCGGAVVVVVVEVGEQGGGSLSTVARL